MKAKPTQYQQDILDKMRNGWELGQDHGISGRCRIQQGGLGKGRKTEDVRFTTVASLLDKGFIELAEYSCPTIRYRLKQSEAT